MKQIININLSKDTPTETLTALYAILKTEKKSKRKQSKLYLFNEDIEKLHKRYEELFKQVKTSENLSEKQIEKECETLSQKYDFEIEVLSNFREVDYDIKCAEIEARRRELKPWRRCWLWRLLFKRLTNRAQDIIEDRAEVDADIIHTAAEEATDKEREKLLSDSDREFFKRLTQDRLDEVIKEADKADVKEVLNETPAASPVQEKAELSAHGQLEGQLSIDELTPAQGKRPRPPRSCRK